MNEAQSPKGIHHNLEVSQCSNAHIGFRNVARITATLAPYLRHNLAVERRNRCGAPTSPTFRCSGAFCIRRRFRMYPRGPVGPPRRSVDTGNTRAQPLLRRLAQRACSVHSSRWRRHPAPGTSSRSDSTPGPLSRITGPGRFESVSRAHQAAALGGVSRLIPRYAAADSDTAA